MTLILCFHILLFVETYWEIVIEDNVNLIANMSLHRNIVLRSYLWVAIEKGGHENS